MNKDFEDAARAEQPGMFQESTNFGCMYYKNKNLAEEAEMGFAEGVRSNNELWAKQYERGNTRGKMQVKVTPIHWPPPNYMPGK